MRLRRGLLHWVILGAAVGTAIALGLSGVSQASPSDQYSAAVSPGSVVAGSPVTLTITNSGPSNLGAATFTIAGSTLAGTPADVQPPTGKSWTAGIDGDAVTLTADSPEDALAPGETVSVDVTPTKAGTYTATTSAGAYNSTEDFSLAGGEPSLTVQPGPVDHFAFGSPSPAAMAGQQSTVTVVAFDQYGNSTDSVGAPTLSSTLEGLGSYTETESFSGIASDGTGVITFTAYKAETGRTVTLTAGSLIQSSSPFDVAPGPVDQLDVGDPSPAAVAGQQSTVPVSAFDQYGNPTDSVGAPLLSSTLEGAGTYTETESLSAFAPDGTAAITFTAYKAETGRTVTVTSGSVTGSSDPFDVAPAAVDHFEFGAPSPSPEAGQESTVSVAAFDQYENPTTDSLGTPVLTSTLEGIGPYAETESLSAFAPDGTATIAFTAYKAETGRTVTVTAGNAKSSTSAPFEVLPAALAQFTWSTEPGSAQTAGAPFTAVVTSFDQYGNVKTNFEPGPADVTVTGLHTSPSAPAIFGSHPGSQAPDYGTLTWAGGVGTLSGVVDRDAETTTLTIANATPSVSETSDSFTVAPASPDALAFTRQPLETQVGAIVNAATTPPFVAVQAIDPFGNLASNTSVAVAIGSNPGSATLGGTTTRPTDASGIATFDDLTISAVGVGYTLVASAPPVTPTATKTSNAFIVAQTVSTCGTTCSGSATVPQNTTLTVSATGTSSANALGITLAAASIPAGVCPGFTDAPGAPAGHVDVSYLDFSASGTPTLRLVWVLDKSLVHESASNSASAYDICLGSVNLLDPQGTSTTGFPTKSGVPATLVHDPVFDVGVFWGLLPDCTKKSTTPCVASRTRKSGDEVVAFDVQYPWDPTPHLG